MPAPKEINLLPPKHEDGLLLGGFFAVAILGTAWWFTPPGAFNYALSGWQGAHILPTYKYGLVAVLSLAVLAAYGGFVTASRPPPSEVHLRGSQLLRGRRGIAQLQAVERKLFSAAQRKRQAPGIKIAGVEFSRTREVGHFSIVGLPGSGKTVLINSMLLQILDRGDRALIHDPKGDFTSWLPADERRRFVILGPWDDRAAYWDIAEDVRTPALADTFARSMYPGTEFWDRAARDVFAAVVKYVQRTHAPHVKDAQKWSFDTLADIFGSGAESVIETARRGDPLIDMLLKDAPPGTENKVADSILSSIAPSVGWIAAIAASRQIRDSSGKIAIPTFSITRWLRGSYPKIYGVVLKNDARYSARAEQIFGVMMGAAAAYLNSSAMPEIDADEPGIWVILDEYPQLGIALAAEVQKVEELGRSRGIRVAKAMQDESQLYETHGRDKGRAQKSVQQTRIYAKTALETAHEVARTFGTRTVQRATLQADGRISSSQTDVAVVLPEDLTGLEVVKSGPQAGVELVINVDNTIVQLVQPFAPRDRTQAVRAKIRDSELWESGLFKFAEEMETRRNARRQGAQAQDKQAEQRAQSSYGAAAAAGGGAASVQASGAVRPTPPAPTERRDEEKDAVEAETPGIDVNEADVEVVEALDFEQFAPSAMSDEVDPGEPNFEDEEIDHEALKEATK